MEDLSEEVDALFELTDRLYFEMWHRIAGLVILQPLSPDSATLEEAAHDTT